MRMSRTCVWAVVTQLAMIVVTAGPVLAQITSATMSGVVKDSSGAVIPGATVTLASADPRHEPGNDDVYRGRLCVSDRSGRHLHAEGHIAGLQDARTAGSGGARGRQDCARHDDDRGRRAGGDGHGGRRGPVDSVAKRRAGVRDRERIDPGDCAERPQLQHVHGAGAGVSSRARSTACAPTRTRRRSTASHRWTPGTTEMPSR